MTDKAIIKALECCSNDEVGLCHICPLNGECHGDVTYMIGLALDLINRRKAEIEELKSICDKERADRLYLSQQNKAIIAGQETLQKALAEKDIEIERLTAEKDQLIKAFDECQAEAVKVFAKRLKKECLIDRGYEILHEGTIDNLVKEMAGDTSER